MGEDEMCVADLAKMVTTFCIVRKKTKHDTKQYQ